MYSLGENIHSIIIGGYNTYNQWHLVPAERPTVDPPALKERYEELPAMNGSLDFSESMYGRKYENRTGSWEFWAVDMNYGAGAPGTTGLENFYGSWNKLYSDILGKIHGKKLRIILTDDPGHFYEGRVQVTSPSTEKDHVSFSIDYNLDPFKYKFDCTKEENNIATKNYVANEYIFLRNTFYRTTTSINVGGTITKNVNVVEDNAVSLINNNSNDIYYHSFFSYTGNGVTKTFHNNTNNALPLRIMVDTYTYVSDGNGSTTVSPSHSPDNGLAGFTVPVGTSTWTFAKSNGSQRVDSFTGTGYVSLDYTPEEMIF